METTDFPMPSIYDPQSMTRSRIVLSAVRLLARCFLSIMAVSALFHGQVRGADDEPASAGVCLFDTGTPSAQPLSPAALRAKQGWVQLPEDETTHRFRGDAVLLNDKLAVVLRDQGRWNRRLLDHAGRLRTADDADPAGGSRVGAGGLVRRQDSGEQSGRGDAGGRLCGGRRHADGPCNASCRSVRAFSKSDPSRAWLGSGCRMPLAMW